MPPIVIPAGHSLPGEPGECWIPAGRLEALTGWVLKPEGLCRGDACTPLPSVRERELVRDGALNFAAAARHLGMPAAADDGAWAFADPPTSGTEAFGSRAAPGFTLPDLDGRLHSLADFRGRKVFLVSWASW